MAGPRCKLDRPERADYIRVFARHLLTDEDYENLTREEWGTVFLLILHQWTKGGTLPEEAWKLAAVGRCSEEELAKLLVKWPKLQPIVGQPGRVGIPYVFREWQQVMKFYDDQTQRSTLGVAARMSKIDPRVTHGLPSGKPKDIPCGLPNQDQDQDKDQEVPPVVPQSGGPMDETAGVEKRKKKRSREEMLVEFQARTRKIMETLAPEWHKLDGPPADRRKINISIPIFGENLEVIWKDHPTLNDDVVIEAARRYLREEHLRYKAPQYFFGAEGPWKGYVKTELTKRAQARIVVVPPPIQSRKEA